MSTNSPGKADGERIDFRAGTRPSAAQFGRALRILFGAHGTGDCKVSLNESGLVVHVPPRRRAAASEVADDWLALADLGIKSMVGNVITLNSGSVLVGDDTYTVAEAAFTLTAPVSYLGWESPYASAAAYWQNFGATKPVQDSSGLRRWYYAIGCTATAAEGEETTYTLAILRYGFLNGYAPANFDT